MTSLATLVARSCFSVDSILVSSVLFWYALCASKDLDPLPFLVLSVLLLSDRVVAVGMKLSPPVDALAKNTGRLGARTVIVTMFKSRRKRTMTLMLLKVQLPVNRKSGV